ncbi:hypothetical protein NPIL_650441 [Nephila pilipes]|uniref:Uncharacterized protein n=1 Tax=Nephila pilipes TaxID=299642 RepID=A0A8X6Q4T1_NEPPI|nr:hypothetical protein NPIL_650441 [Nephila pilipes]
MLELMRTILPFAIITVPHCDCRWPTVTERLAPELKLTYGMKAVSRMIGVSLHATDYTIVTSTIVYANVYGFLLLQSCLGLCCADNISSGGECPATVTQNNKAVYVRLSSIEKNCLRMCQVHFTTLELISPSFGIFLLITPAKTR